MTSASSFRIIASDNPDAIPLSSVHGDQAPAKLLEQVSRAMLQALLADEAGAYQGQLSYLPPAFKQHLLEPRIATAIVVEHCRGCADAPADLIQRVEDNFQLNLLELAAAANKPTLLKRVLTELIDSSNGELPLNSYAGASMDYALCQKNLECIKMLAQRGIKPVNRDYHIHRLGYDISEAMKIALAIDRLGNHPTPCVPKFAPSLSSLASCKARLPFPSSPLPLNADMQIVHALMRNRLCLPGGNCSEPSSLNYYGYESMVREMGLELSEVLESGRDREVLLSYPQHSSDKTHAHWYFLRQFSQILRMTLSKDPCYHPSAYPFVTSILDQAWQYLPRAAFEEFLLNYLRFDLRLLRDDQAQTTTFVVQSRHIMDENPEQSKTLEYTKKPLEDSQERLVRAAENPDWLLSATTTGETA